MAINASLAHRIDIQIATPTNDLLSGWLYPSARCTPSNPGPALVLAHGLGATKELKLDVYAAHFHQHGYTCVVFDYRCTGGSTGQPRGLIDWSRQQEDWKCAIAYARQLENVDADRVGLFGTSFSGGHVVQLAAGDARLKAVVSQCPFTDGVRSSLCTGFSAMLRLGGLGVLDWVFGSDTAPVTVSLVGSPGESMYLSLSLSLYPSTLPKKHADESNLLFQQQLR